MAVGVLCALFSGVFRYIDQHFFTAETFLENNAELADNADIRTFLFEGFRQEIIQLAEGDVEEEESSGTVADRLDDEADELDPVTEEEIERDLAIEAVLLDVFDSDAYDELFTQALTGTQTQIVRSAELESAALLRDKGEIFFDMRGLYNELYPRLGADPRTSAITQNEVPTDYGVFKVADRDTTINPLWTLMRKASGWRGLMTLGAFMSLIGALVIADRRPSTAIQFGSGMIGLAVVLIVIVFLIRFVVPLLTGGSSANHVAATYATNTAPLVSGMIRLAIWGAVLAAVGGIARYIWPDNWVYSSVSDDRGVRSIARRRGEPEPAPQQTRPAAAVPVGYPGYPQQQPYGGYPPQWGGYPGQYPPGYAVPYPVGPYGQAQPMQQQPPQHYTSPGQPTVPVTPVVVDGQTPQLVPPTAPPHDAAPGGLPADAAQVVPRVVATTDTTLDASTNSTGGESEVQDSIVDGSDTAESSASAGAKATIVDGAVDNVAASSDEAVSSETLLDQAKQAVDDADEWATEKDW